MSMTESDEYLSPSERWPDGEVPVYEYEDVCNDRDRYRRALEEITALNMPYRDTANRAKQIARKATE